MRWLAFVVALLLLVGATPAFQYLLDAADIHACASEVSGGDGCPEDEKGCSGEVHTCLCHHGPSYLVPEAALALPVIEIVEIVYVSESPVALPEGQPWRVERPPRVG